MLLICAISNLDACRCFFISPCIPDCSYIIYCLLWGSYWSSANFSISPPTLNFQKLPPSPLHSRPITSSLLSHHPYHTLDHPQFLPLSHLTHYFPSYVLLFPKWPHSPIPPLILPTKTSSATDYLRLFWTKNLLMERLVYITGSIGIISPVLPTMWKCQCTFFQ